MIHIDDLHPTVFLIDFGLVVLFHNPATYLHTPLTTNHSIIGTLPFVSINGQQGYSQSYRDDLESLAYTIIYSVLGYLPWTDNSISNDKKAILRKKTSVTVEELCTGLPLPFSEFVTYVYSLGFDQKPDYQYLHSILLQCLQVEANQPVEASLIYSCPPVSMDCEPIPTGRDCRV